MNSDKLILKRKDKAGFFSSCSLSLYKIIDFIKKNKKIPNVEFEEFAIYKEKREDNLYKYIFKENINDLNIEEITEIKFNLLANNCFYKDSDSVKLNQLIERWFCPNDEIQRIKNNFIVDTDINFSSALSIYFRGTDTQLDRGICCYNVFVNKVRHLINNKEIKQILLQTDDKMFQDYILSSDLNIPILTIKEIKPIYSNVGFHFKIKRNKIKHIKDMVAVTLLMSECKYNLCNASNLSRWILLYKKEKENFYQFLGNSCR